MHRALTALTMCPFQLPVAHWPAPNRARAQIKVSADHVESTAHGRCRSHAKHCSCLKRLIVFFVVVSIRENKTRENLF